MYKQLITNTCKVHGLLRNQAAYVLATAEWETNHTFEPVREAYWVKDAEAWRKRNLRYWPWYGRGFVQLTWKANYAKAGAAIGVDLIANPDAAMDPDNAAKILVLGMREGWFTGKALEDFITLEHSDFDGARKIVNGTDRAATIAALARNYDAELLRAGYGVDDPMDEPEVPAPAPTPLVDVLAGVQGWLFAIILAVAGIAVGIWSWIAALIERMF